MPDRDADGALDGDEINRDESPVDRPTPLDGTDCDPQWTWHVAPGEMEWVDFMMELCDGLPSMVEDERTCWLGDVGTFCPWIVNVVDVSAR